MVYLMTLTMGLGRDLKLAWLGLRRRAGFFALVVFVLATGFGSAVAAFGILEAMQFRPLPFAAPDRLIQIAIAHEGRPLEAQPLFRQDLLAFANRRDVLEGVGAFGTGGVTFGDAGRAERYDAGFVSTSLFPLLGVQPARGRLFAREDGAPGAALTVLISDELWHQSFGSEDDVIGRQIRVGRQPATIVGIMPPGFAFPYRQRLWLPLTDSIPGDASDVSRAVGVARLAPGADLERAAGTLSPLLEQSRERVPSRYQGYRLRVQPLSWFFVDWQARAGQRMLFIAVLAILLVAIANAAGLMLAHTRSREQEWALRAAMGAPRSDRIVAGLATGLIVTAIGLVVALPMASGALTWLEGELLRAEDPSPYYMNLGLTPATITFAIATAAFAAVVIGILPALRFGAPTRVDSAGPRVTGSRRLAALAGGTVGVQIALTLTVVLVTAVMVQSVDTMGRRDLGVTSSGVLTARLSLPTASYPSAEARAAFWERLTTFVAREPGIRLVTVANAVPGFMGDVEGLQIEGAPAGQDVVRASTTVADTRFLDTYQIRLISGRDFRAQDDEAAPQVAIVDRRFAASAWPGQDPLGRRLRGDGEDGEWVQVVGVISNVHFGQVDDPPIGSVLVPLAQHPPEGASLAVRTDADPYDALPAIRRAAARVDPDLPVYMVSSLPDAIRQGYSYVRIFARVIGWLGLSALLMTAAGLYALLAGRVAQRTREIGIRRALGAGTGAIGRAVVRQVAVPLTAGGLFGVLFALPVARALVAIEPTVIGTDSSTYGLAIGALALAAAVAIAAPLARALAIAPIEALRHD